MQTFTITDFHCFMNILTPLSIQPFRWHQGVHRWLVGSHWPRHHASS